MEEWHKPPKKQTERRTLRVTGRLTPGSSLEREHTCNLLYEYPHPPEMADGGPGTRGWMGADIQSVDLLADGRAVFTIEERVTKNVPAYPDLPDGDGAL
jgi:hypothetical protein